MIKNLTIDSEEVRTICQNDPQMAKLIHIVRDLPVHTKGDRFGNLVHSIIGQLLSIKAANTISSRLLSLVVEEVSPISIGKVSDQELRSIGISARKVSYIRDLCEKVMNGELVLDQLDELSNEEIMNSLMRIKGIGKWTAEMFLIFSVGRLDVLSLDDISLQRACKWVFEVDKTVDGKKFLSEKGANWKPYSSIASFYLWAAVNKGFVDYFQNMAEVEMNRLDFLE
jgi:DNA-3-methyladenine glycosylase II